MCSTLQVEELKVLVGVRYAMLTEKWEERDALEAEVSTLRAQVSLAIQNWVHASEWGRW